MSHRAIVLMPDEVILWKIRGTTDDQIRQALGSSRQTTRSCYREMGETSPLVERFYWAWCRYGAGQRPLGVSDQSGISVLLRPIELIKIAVPATPFVGRLMRAWVRVESANAAGG